MKNRPPKVLPASSDHSKRTTKQQTVKNSDSKKPVEFGGPKGPEPTRYGDWEKGGRCSDF